MNFHAKWKKFFGSHKLLLSIICLPLSILSFSQPANDNCANASAVNISNSGFGLGIFSSTVYDISAATVQPGETFAPAILVAVQTQKSIWYKFTLPTTRAVRVTLAQTGNAITSGDVGFAVYKTNTCLPTVANISTKLTPIGVFGSTYHPCVEPGDYLVQVSAKSAANGTVYIQVETDTTTNTAYDHPVEAYDFGTLAQGVKTITYSVDCHSSEDATEVCTALSNYQQYNKSTWHVFKTAAYFDYVAFFLSNQNYSTTQKFGYTLYQGDIRTTPFSSLPVVDGCDSLLTTFYAARKYYKCGDLDPNTTYSIQIFFHQSFNDNVQVTLATTGTNATQAPEPILSAIPPSNSLGVLPSSPAGITTTTTDYHACNSRHSIHPCNPSLPAAGVTYNNVSYNGYNFNLSTFFRFTLSSTSNLNISANQSYHSQPLFLRLYKQDVSNTCNTLDTANIISQFVYSNNNLNCLDPGNYTLQILGRDSIVTNYYSYYGYLANSTSPVNLLTDLGQKFTLNINVQTIRAISKYSLNVPGAFDTLHAVGGVMQPLVNSVNYVSIDTFSCSNTVLPSDTVCSPSNTKAIYREFAVADSGVVTLYNAYPPPNNTWTKLYMGDANALANAQNVHSYPLRITGLTPFTECLQYNYYCPGARTCVVPGTYTYVAFGGDVNIAQVNRVNVEFNLVNTTHNSLATAEDMGSILSLVPPTGGSVQSSNDYYSCKDNAIPINGYQPCTISGVTATKAIYRQFYLSAPANVSISGTNGCDYNGGYKTLFSGKATDGIAGLTVLPAPWQCFQSASVGTCNTLPAGWYTVVSYGIGQTYANPLQSNILNYQSYIGLINRITITVTIPCPAPKYNRPYKAAVDTLTNQPFLIQWAPRVGHTAAYPKTDTTYTLYRENFNCTVDTPFSIHPIPSCNALLTKVAYYVFRTTQESYLSINTRDFWGAVYAGNARTDSATFASATPIQTCLQSYGQIQICRLQPGTYTLVIFATSANSCTNVIPTIYIDQVGYSRFDHANNAYDFGAIPPDSLYHNGKAGDVNPLNAGRPPSNDFFYCTTGSQQNDPGSIYCLVYNPNIYNAGINNALYSSTNPIGDNYVPRRNLWYTFVVNQPGRVRVKVSNKTISKQTRYIFSIYRSNVDGTLPFTTVVSTGQVDSTIAQGLTYIDNNYYGFCMGDKDTVSFYREPCTSIPQRYYIIVDNPSSWDNSGGMHPNSQTEVSILLDSIDVNYPGDFCSDPLVASLNGPGISTSSVTVDCHTIGTDYGEFNPTLTCPTGATTTNYKTSWFKINITGSDTLDVTTWLSENTNALPSEIKYRLMNGDCGAMQERSCVQDALTHDTYKCLPPGSYYVQVFTPVLKNGVKVTGTIDLHLSAVLRADTCAPVNNCLSNATFIPQFDCNTSDIVTFVNYSTYGSSIQYNWDFGYNGQTSTAVAPQFFYPILSTNQTYTVSLTVQNTSCGGQSTYTVPVTIPGRSNLELGNDTTFCTPGSSLLLNATSWPGATYLWQNNSTGPTFNVTAGGVNTCWVRVTYNGCIKRDTIRVRINPITRLLQTKYLCGNDSVLLNSNRGQGETHSWSTGATSSSIYAKTAGVYINTITWNGCIIRDTFNIINAVAPFANNDTTICYPFHSFTLNATTPGATGYLWQNNSTSATYTVTAPGVYWVRVNNGTCFKRDTITVLVSAQAVTDSTNAVICSGQSYTLPGGGTAIATGIYRDTLRYSTGCDSVRRIVNLRVQTFTTVTTNPGICSGQNYTLPWGIVVSAAGVYRDTLRYTTGCDSVRRIVNLTVNATSSSATNTTICSNQLPYNWNGTNYNAAGTYIYHALNAVGCDSAATLNLTVNATSSSTTNITRCSNQLPITWNATNYSAAGTYVYHTLNAVGCDSAATLNLTVNAVSSSTTNVTTCSNQLPYTWNGTNYNAGGSFTFITANATGCDSVATLNLTINNTSTSVTNVARCSNQLPYTWNGTNYNAGGNFTFTTVNAAGCDSAATLNLTINNTSTSVTYVTRCSNQLPYMWNGTNYNAAGTYVYHTLNATGCDSAATLNLTVNVVSSSTTNITRCSNQLPYTWNGTNYNAAGSYVYHTLNAVGCDSAATLNLTINNTSTSVTNVTRCFNQLPYTWNGTNYNATGTYVYHTLNAAGCDSAATLYLTINATSSSSTNTTICSNQLPFNWNSINYSVAGTYVYHTLNAVGCDSAATLNLTVNAVSSSTTNITRCSNQLPYTWNGTNYNAAGTFVYHTLNAVGCDSAATLNLIVNAVSSSTTNVTRCSNQLPYTWNGINYNAAGAFVYHTLNAAGCDSAATLNLTINNTSTSFTNITRCSNQLPYTWNGTNYNAAGTFVYHTLNAVGCDSAATLNLTVNAVSSSSTNVTRCSNQLPYTWNGTNYNAAGTYVYHTLNAVGCDSAATLNLTVNAVSSSTTNITRCSNQLPYTWNGTNYNAAGAYVYHTLNTSGCDSAATLNLTVQSPSSQTFNPIICAGQTYTLPWGTPVTAAGIYRDTLLYTTGCDSLRRTVNLTVQTTTSVTTNPVICAGQTYMLPWGTVATTSGVYRDTLRYATGCDSIRRFVILTVQSPASVTTNPVICQGGSYTLPWGVIVNAGGTYRDTLYYATGCDSVRRTVNLQVIAAAVSTTNATICSDETYTLPWGTVINVAGIYKDTVRTSAGCDSLIRNVNLVVNSVPSVSVSKSNDINCMLGITNLQASGGVNYSWTPAAGLNNANIYNPVASPSATTWYKVIVTSDKECTTEDSIQIKVIPGNPDNGYLVPNAFTPNGDGRNDCFGVQTWGAVTDFEFSIFSRWGERVFYTKDPKQCWDGRYKGTEQSANVFVYQIKAKGLCGDIYRKGTFVLIR